MGMVYWAKTDLPYLRTDFRNTSFLDGSLFCSIVERRYKQMLEEEQKSLARNKKLLEDIDRLEEQIKFFSNECKQDEERLKKAKVLAFYISLCSTLYIQKTV